MKVVLFITIFLTSFYLYSKDLVEKYDDSFEKSIEHLQDRLKKLPELKEVFKWTEEENIPFFIGGGVVRGLLSGKEGETLRALNVDPDGDIDIFMPFEKIKELHKRFPHAKAWDCVGIEKEGNHPNFSVAFERAWIGANDYRDPHNAFKAYFNGELKFVGDISSNPVKGITVQYNAALQALRLVKMDLQLEKANVSPDVVQSFNKVMANEKALPFPLSVNSVTLEHRIVRTVRKIYRVTKYDIVLFAKKLEPYGLLPWLAKSGVFLDVGGNISKIGMEKVVRQLTKEGLSESSILAITKMIENSRSRSFSSVFRRALFRQRANSDLPWNAPPTEVVKHKSLKEKSWSFIIKNILEPLNLYEKYRDIVVKRLPSPDIDEFVLEHPEIKFVKQIGEGMHNVAYRVQLNGEDVVLKVNRGIREDNLKLDVKIQIMLEQNGYILGPRILSVDPKGKWAIYEEVKGLSFKKAFQDPRGLSNQASLQQLTELYHISKEIETKLGVSLDINPSNLIVSESGIQLIDYGPRPAHVPLDHTLDLFLRRFFKKSGIAASSLLSHGCNEALSRFIQ